MRTIDDECVVLEVSTYNKLLRESLKANCVIDSLFNNATLDLDGSGVFIRSIDVTSVLELMYPERFKSCVDHLNIKKIPQESSSDK